jgi:chromosome partitioning protein
VGQTIACANQKGGVGKTTTVVNVGTYLALAGQRVLIVDVDPQGNATSGLGVDRAGLDLTLYEALTGAAELRDVIVATKIANLFIVPSSVGLAGAEMELAPTDQRERRLARLLAEVAPDYDYLLLDCPPSVGLLTVNALTAADAVLIPIQCEYYALEGLTQLIATVNLVRDNLNPDLEIKGVVLTMFDGRTNLSADVAAEVRRHLGSAVFDTIVPRSIRLSEAPSFGLPIALHRPDSKGAEAYAALAVELLGRNGSTRVGQPSSLPAMAIEARADADPVPVGGTRA